MGTHAGTTGRRIGFVAAGLLLLILGSCRPDADRVFVVDTTVDSVDSAPGDGVCADGSGACSIRAAVNEANALAAAGSNAITEVQVPVGAYRLEIEGLDEDDGFTGDLDFNAPLYLVGVGGVPSIDASAVVDRVLDIHVAGWHGTSNLKIVGGGNPVIVGGAMRLNAGTFNGNLQATNNTAGAGGAIAVHGGTLLLEESTIHGNSADVGGAVLVTGGTAVLHQVTVSENQSGAGSSAVHVGGGTMRMYWSTVNRNVQGGVHIDAGASGFATSTIISNTFDGPNCTGAITSNDYNLSSDTSCTIGQPHDLPETDPDLALLGPGDGQYPVHHLGASSPARDAVPSAENFCLTLAPVDANGAVRPVGSACDIGAVEAVAATWFRDADLDTYGTTDDTVTAFDPPAGYVAVDGDCDDSDPGRNPTAAEIPDDGIDQDCDGHEIYTPIDSGDPMPNLFAPGFAGEWGLHNHQGKVIILHFCAMWCAPCQSYTSTLAAAISEVEAIHGPDSLEVVEVVLEDLNAQPTTLADIELWKSVFFPATDITGLHLDGGNQRQAECLAGAIFSNSLGLPSFAVIDTDLTLVKTAEGGLDVVAEVDLLLG